MAVEDGTKRSVLSTKQLVTIIVLTGLLGGLISGYFGHTLLKSMGSGGKDLPMPINKYDDAPDPDERPPIIINNGSVVLTPYNGVNGRGGWAGSAQTWTHDPVKGRATVALQLRANLFSDPQGSEKELQACMDKDGTGPYVTPFTADKLEIEYLQSGNKKVIKVKIAPGSAAKKGVVEFNYPGGVTPKHDPNYQTLTVDSDPDTAWTVRIGDYTCTYAQPQGQKVVVKILQLK